MMLIKERKIEEQMTVMKERKIKEPMMLIKKTKNLGNIDAQKGNKI